MNGQKLDRNARLMLTIIILLVLVQVSLAFRY
jgi:predicted nucleic acid-binding Zn ribbon protein